VISRANASDAPGALGALLAARPSGRPLAQRELRSHVLGLLLAGNETTAAALSWAWVHGARNPRAWTRLRDEPASVRAYLDETLRLTPPVWGIPRFARRATQLRSGAVDARVGRGQGATIYLRGLNRDPRVWHNPTQFDPARHTAIDTEQHRALLPFGLGPRGCIGQHLAMAEMVAVLPAVARLGDVTIDEPAEEDPSFALRVAGGLRGRLATVTAPASGSPE
jgi:cytochrome P450